MKNLSLVSLIVALVFATSANAGDRLTEKEALQRVTQETREELKVKREEYLGDRFGYSIYLISRKGEIDQEIKKIQESEISSISVNPLARAMNRLRHKSKLFQSEINISQANKTGEVSPNNGGPSIAEQSIKPTEFAHTPANLEAAYRDLEMGSEVSSGK